MGDVTVKPPERIWAWGHSGKVDDQMFSPYRCHWMGLDATEYVRADIAASPSGFNDGVRAALEYYQKGGCMGGILSNLLRPEAGEDAALNAICDERSGGPTLRVTLSELDE